LKKAEGGFFPAFLEREKGIDISQDSVIVLKIMYFFGRKL